MLLEIHVHTREHSPCSSVRGADLLQALYRQHIDGVILTDHHHLWSDDALERLRTATGIPRSFVVLSGQEVNTSDYGDVLVYGANASIGPGVTLAALRKQHPGAALVWAHPWRYGQVPGRRKLLNPVLDAVEIVNPHQRAAENIRAVCSWGDLKFTATSGSDIHNMNFRELYPVRLEQGIGSMDDFVSCLRSGQCRPSTGRYVCHTPA